MKKGPKCAICQRPDIAEINTALIGNSCAKVGGMFKLAISSVNQHKRNCVAKPSAKGLAVKEPPPPANGTPVELANWHCERIDARIKAATAENSGRSEREIAGLYAQYTNASRHRDRLNGALDLTAAQIIKTPDFMRLLAAFKTACGSNREVWARWEAELGDLLGYARKA